MDTTYIISAWANIIQHFFPIFATPTAKMFMNLVSGWILCTTKHTITGILPFAKPDKHRAHDAYHRFFPDASWAISELWRFLTILPVKIFYPTGKIHLDLDDTLFHHSGKKVDGAGWDLVDETANGTDDIWWILEGRDYLRLWREESN